MSLTVPLSVRLSTPKGDVHVTRDLHDLSFRTAVPGGFASATLALSRPLSIQPNEITEFGQVYIYDRRTGGTVWEGRLEDSGRSAGESGEVWQVTATGPAAHAQDSTVPIVYVDRRLDAWAIGAQSTSSVNIQTTDGDAILMQVSAGSTFVQNTSGLIVYHGVAYTGQALGRVHIPWTAGFGSSNVEIWFGTAIDNAATVSVDVDTASASGDLEGSRGGANAIGADHNSVRLRVTRVNGTGDLAVTNDLIWVSFNSPRVRALLKNASGTDITSGYTTDTVLASDVVSDLLGRLLPRYDGTNASVEGTSFEIDQFAYPDGASAQKILEDLMAIEPAYYWAAWETNPNTGKYRFEWRAWPTTVRYDASTADGFDSPASAAELYNAVSVRWRAGFGVSRTTRSTQTVPVLDAAGLTREAYIDLSDELGSDAIATRVGQEFLAEHGTVLNQGSLTVSRPVLDMDRGRYVMPWEIRPGALIRVSNVLPRIDSLNPTGRDGITVFKIAAVDFNASSATATLELDSYPLTVARAIAELSKRRITRKR